MILPFSFRNGYGKDLCPRPVTTVELRFVDETIGDDTFVVEGGGGGTVGVDLEGELSPKILAMEKLIPDVDLLDEIDSFRFSAGSFDDGVGATAKGRRMGN